MRKDQGSHTPDRAIPLRPMLELVDDQPRRRPRKTPMVLDMGQGSREQGFKNSGCR
jgi:hypothetical protein